MSYWNVILTSAAIGALALIAVAFFLMARWLAMILDQNRRVQRLICFSDWDLREYMQTTGPR